MSSSATSNKNNRSDIIDFDFFESEDYQTKVYNKQKQRDSSKIITKAVIETEPHLLDFSENSSIDKHSEQHLGVGKLSQYRKQSDDCLSSPSSSMEKKLLGLNDADLDTLMNCLAYSEDDKLNGRVLVSPHSFNFKESCDNSLSDSTITTITSDFTSISPLSSFSLLSSSSNSISDDHDENSAASESNLDSERPSDLCIFIEDLKKDQRDDVVNDEVLDELKEPNELNGLKESNSECDDVDQQHESQEEYSNSPEAYESDFESYKETKYLEQNFESGGTVGENGEQLEVSLSAKESHGSSLEDELGDISITQSRSNSVKTSFKKRKNGNLTFSREELIRIERDNLILLKKIMAHSKHKPVSLNQQSLSHKKTSTAINRAKLQKKIEQDNYILYSKISAMSRLKKVF